MEPSNVKTFFSLALVFLGMISYFVLAIGLGVEQSIPWPHFLVMIAGCVALGVLLERSPGWKRGLSLALGVVMTLFFVWYTLDYSAYTSRDHRVDAGDRVAEVVGLRLADHQGDERPVLVEGAKATLLVFYRGYW